MRKREGYLIFAIILLLSMTVISAGIFDFFKTGKASSAPQNVSVSVVGANAVIITVPPASGTPNEFGSRTIIFDVNVTDPDGVSDINTTSVRYEITKVAQTTKTGNCPYQNIVNSTTSNFTCTTVLWYYEADGAWNIRVEGKDIGNTTLMNGTNTLTYGSLNAFLMSPSSISWPGVTTGGANQQANNDPTIINNTGNYVSTISIIGINLIGEAIQSEMIPANNFTAGPSTGGAECSATPLVNGSSVVIAGSSSNPGNISAGGGAGQANIYYCIPSVPLVSSQIYSTNQGGSWTVSYT